MAETCKIVRSRCHSACQNSGANTMFARCFVAFSFLQQRCVYNAFSTATSLGRCDSDLYGGIGADGGKITHGL